MIRGGLVVGIGLGAAVLCGPTVASAAPDTEASSSTADSAPVHGHRGPPTGSAVTARPAAAVRPGPASSSRLRPDRVFRPEGALSAGSVGRTAVPAVPAVTVQLPPMPLDNGQSFEVSPGAITTAANDFVVAGGDPKDNPRFFFGDLAVRSLDALAGPNPPPQQVRANLGNLAVSGYFGGVWLRDNLSGAPAAITAPTGTASAASTLAISAIGIRLFDAMSAGLAGLATSKTPWIATTAARASVPVLLTLYGYNRGYLQYLLEHPPAGVPSRLDSLSCTGFLACNSTAFPLAIADRYDAALNSLDSPPNLPWQEMKAWTSLLEGATGTGRFVWGIIGQAGFSPASYDALVDLSSAYLMVSKAAVLSSMLAYTGGDADLARSSLRLQAGLWMWSGAYFGGLASDAPRGTIPTIVAS